MEWWNNTSLSVLNTAQNVVITTGLTVGTVLCAWYVYKGYGLTAGDYVLFSTYMIQLYSPLNFFGAYYRCCSFSVTSCAFPALTLLVGRREEHAACKKIE